MCHGDMHSHLHGSSKLNASCAEIRIEGKSPINGQGYPFVKAWRNQ